MVHHRRSLGSLLTSPKVVTEQGLGRALMLAHLDAVTMQVERHVESTICTATISEDKLRVVQSV